jgi:cation transporter-like permease
MRRMQRIASADSLEQGSSMTRLSLGFSTRRKVLHEVRARGQWLLILMMFQSGSSFVLNHYETLVREHLVLTLFLTMLVGAGGNAGAQSAMQTLQQITAEGEVVSLRHTLRQQGMVAVCLGVLLACMAWLRVYFFHGGFLNATAIALSCGIIVITSIVIGASLPFLLIRCRQDPVHSGAAVQVLMDLWGVLVSCIICKFLLSATDVEISHVPGFVLGASTTFQVSSSPLNAPDSASSAHLADKPVTEIRTGGNDHAATGATTLQRADVARGVMTVGAGAEGGEGASYTRKGREKNSRRLLGDTASHSAHREDRIYSADEVEMLLMQAVTVTEGRLRERLREGMQVQLPPTDVEVHHLVQHLMRTGASGAKTVTKLAKLNETPLHPNGSRDR